MISSSKQAMERHVAVLGFPTHGFTILKFLRRLAAAGPTTIFSVFNTGAANRSVFSAQVRGMMENVRVYDVADGMAAENDVVLPDRMDVLLKPDRTGINATVKVNIAERMERFLNATPRNYREAVEAAEAEIGMKISCLVGDVFLWFAADMAQEMGVPWVAVTTAALYSLSVHLFTDEIRNAVPLLPEPLEDQTLEFIPGFGALKVKDLDAMILKDRDSTFSTLLYKMGLALPRATAIATNSFEGLEPTAMTDTLRRKLRNVFSVGPYELLSPPAGVADVNDCLEWLDSKEEGSVVYICFGSITSPPPDEIAALAKALEASGTPFLWSLKEHAMENLPEGFLNRTAVLGQGKVVSWAPQPRVLAHSSVAVFLTHGGWNSVIESIIGEVPMICRPFFADQFLNTRMVVDVWGIGLGVEGGVLTKGGVVSSLGLILSCDEGKEMRNKVKVMKELAARAVEQPNGTSTQNFNSLVELITTSTGMVSLNHFSPLLGCCSRADL